MTKASVFSPAYVPVFDPTPTRGATRVRRQSGGGGVSEFPFQYSWPGLVNFTGESPRIATLAGMVIYTVYTTFLDGSSTVTYRILVNGSTVVDTISRSSSGINAIEHTLNPFDVVSVEITGIGTGAARGIWVGISPEQVLL